MIKKTITYPDYNGVEITEDFYFNLSKTELMEMELGTTGGFIETTTQVLAAKDGPAILKAFKDLVLKSYGQKSPDGKRFIKTPELAESFAQTEAYSQLFYELITDSDAVEKFVNGIIPADMSKKIDQKTLREMNPALADMIKK